MFVLGKFRRALFWLYLQRAARRDLNDNSSWVLSYIEVSILFLGPLFCVFFTVLDQFIFGLEVTKSLGKMEIFKTRYTVSAYTLAFGFLPSLLAGYFLLVYKVDRNKLVAMYKPAKGRREVFKSELFLFSGFIVAFIITILVF